MLKQIKGQILASRDAQKQNLQGSKSSQICCHPSNRKLPSSVFFVALRGFCQFWPVWISSSRRVSSCTSTACFRMIQRVERENSPFPDVCEAQLWVGKELQSPAFSRESHQLCILLFYFCFYYDQNVVFSKKIPESQGMKTWRDPEVRCYRADRNPEGSGNSGQQRTLNPWNKNDDKMWGN